jgi:hypothetical protein
MRLMNTSFSRAPQVSLTPIPTPTHSPSHLPESHAHQVSDNYKTSHSFRHTVSASIDAIIIGWSCRFRISYHSSLPTRWTVSTYYDEQYAFPQTPTTKTLPLWPLDTPRHLRHQVHLRPHLSAGKLSHARANVSVDAAQLRPTFHWPSSTALRPGQYGWKPASVSDPEKTTSQLPGQSQHPSSECCSTSS